MDNSYHQVQQMPPFAYYHSNGKLDVQQSELANHHANANALLYQSQMSQSLQSFNLFPPPPPEEPNNSIPFSQLYQNGGYPGSVQMSSHYKKENNLLASNIPPNLLIQPNIHENDVYYYPSTPPLSASPSISGSPSDYTALPTPANTTIFGIHRSKDDLVSENGNYPNWICYDSPPITPAFIHSGSLISDDISHNNLSIQRPSNSPSTSPLPSQVPTDHNLDFCDPRKLTVCPGVQTCTNLENSEALPNIVHLSPSRVVAEDQKLLLSRSISPRTFSSKDSGYHGMQQSELPVLEPTSDFDVGENYFCGISNFSVSDDQSIYMASKRQRTDSGISLSHGPVINPAGFQEIDQTGSYNQFAITCPLSPPTSISERDRKNAKRFKKTKKMSPEITHTSDHNPEIYESEIGMKTEYTSESPNNCRNDKANETSNTGAASEKSKSGDPSKTQNQVTRRGRKQSETEDLTKTFVCESCNRRFKRQEHLKRHYRSVHTQEKPFKCHECGKDFSRSDNLSQHARTHGNGSIVVGLLEEGEIPNDLGANCEHIGNLGSILFNAAAAAPGSETDRSSQCSSNGSSSIGKESQSRKKRRRPE